MKKREHPRFRVPNFGARNRKRVKERWRKPRGIDNKQRVMRSGYGRLPKIGYKNSASVRYLRADGTLNMLVHNEGELISAARGKNVSIVLAHALSFRKRQMLQRTADRLGVKVKNRS